MARAISLERPSVLVVDDDPEFAGLLGVGLSTGGFHVHVCATGSEACAILDSEQIEIAVIDLDLHQMAAWELLERLRLEYPMVLPFILSGNIDVPRAVNAMRAGAVDVLEKPIRLEVLELRLREALARGRRGETTPHTGTPRPVAPASGTRLSEARGIERIVGNSAAVARVRDQIEGIARFNQVATLIVGETGTGKEVVARALHEISAPGKPLVTINCAAIPETLFESELFGHEAGSFTGARGSKPGLLEAAGDGTILLDEVGEMALAMQPKLLRVLQDRTFRRVGGSRDIELRARIISATNRRLSAARQDGMRSDLYFRLAGFTIVLPPLRHRLEDIELLSTEFLREFARQYPGVPTTWNDDALARLLEHAWRGNVRELKRVVEQAAVLSRGSVIERAAVEFALREDTGGSSLPPPGSVRESRSFRLASSPMRFEEEPSQRAAGLAEREAGLNEVQQKMILDAYEANARNLTRAARALRIPRTTLRDRLKRYGWL